MNIIITYKTTDIEKIKEIQKTPIYKDVLKSFIHITSYLKYHNTKLIFLVDVNEVNASSDPKNDIIYFYDVILKLDFNSEDIYALLGHEFGHIYLHKNYYISPYEKGTREYNWDIEFNADRICVNILKDLNMNPNALKNLHQKVLKYYTLKDIADNEHPALQERIERL